jgi:hypothetical protein
VDACPEDGIIRLSGSIFVLCLDDHYPVSSPQFNFCDNSDLDLLVLQKMELYGLAGAMYLAALRLDNHHPLCFTLVSTVLFWFPKILI